MKRKIFAKKKQKQDTSNTWYNANGVCQTCYPFSSRKDCLCPASKKCLECVLFYRWNKSNPNNWTKITTIHHQAKKQYSSLRPDLSWGQSLANKI